MSKHRSAIIITPPIFLDLSRMESTISPGHICSYCHGNGWTWGDEIKTKCKICEGTGRLDAQITIEWRPSNSKQV